jgi:hypothetical protein
MTNEVEPLAATLSLVVVRPSRRVATKRKVPSGHQPGNGDRNKYAAPPATKAAPATVTTRRLTLASRDIGAAG